ncbi:hypothetical protein ACRAWC_15485 [Leifsonia sp. L25]
MSVLVLLSQAAAALVLIVLILGGARDEPETQRPGRWTWDAVTVRR